MDQEALAVRGGHGGEGVQEEPLVAEQQRLQRLQDEANRQEELERREANLQAERNRRFLLIQQIADIEKA